MIKQLRFFFYSILFVNFSIAQVNCPLNTREFPFETSDPDGSFSWSAGLYMPSQLGGAQTFTSLSFRLDNIGGWGCDAFDNDDYFDVRIYMRHTAVNNFASDPGYPGTAGFTQVWSGSMAFPSSGVYTYPLSTNFVYNGVQNLELLIENRGGRYCSGKPEFDRTNDAGVGNFPGKVGYGSNWANATIVSSNRRFNLQINNVGCGGFPLPVTLKDAVASCQDGKAMLEWETLSEINNDFFTIEKSYDGDNWRKIAKINGSGTTTSSSVYSFEDTEVNNSMTYYRLSQTDYNGDYEMLRVFALDCTSKSKSNVSVYPNPFKNELIVNKNNTTEVNVFNALGQKMYPSFSENSVSYIFNTTDFPKGVYIVQIVSNNLTHSVRVVK